MLMTSLYDMLGAHADDDRQALTSAFRKAVKASHPDLHPNDPEAVLRFREVINAGAVLRDAERRAAYDQRLDVERQQVKLRHDLQRQQRRLKRRRQAIRVAVTVVAILVLIGGYGLLMPTPPAAIVSIVKNKLAAEPVRKDDAASWREKEIAEANAEPEMEWPRLQARADGASRGIVDELRPGTAPFAMDKGDAATPADPAIRAPDIMPDDATFYRDLGAIAYRLGDFAGAIANLNEAVRLDPNDADAFNIRGNAWDEMGVFDGALADYGEAIRINPNNAAFFHDRAILWHRKGELDNALVDFDRAIRSSLSDPNIYCDRGLVWYEKGDYGRAIADFNQALELDPDFAAACISRGLILHRNSDFTIAFGDIDRMIRVDPSVFDISQRLK